LDEEGDEQESDQILQQVLDEIGISVEQSLPGAGNAQLSHADAGGVANKIAEPEFADSDLEARLNNLRKE
jgi:charged multivesicular body protein 2A